MALHRTPVHHMALGLVRDRQVVWRPDLGVSGGFAHASGQRPDPAMLVALWEMRFESLVEVQDEAVVVTVAGRRRLSLWDRGGRRA